MPHTTLILSDTHLGKPSGATAAALRPLWQGIDELVVNGDTAEVQVPWLRSAAVRELDQLETLTAKDGVKLTLISGNHDAYLTDRRCLQLGGGSILVMHGDALHPAVAPWTRYAESLANRTEREIARAAQDDLANRLDIAQHVGHSEFLREYVIASLGENTLKRILARPIEVPLVLSYWRKEPALAERFLERYAPQTKTLIVGHSHRRRISQRNGRTIINTGAFMFPGKPQGVIHQGDTLRVQRILARPIEVPLVLSYWRKEPALAERFLERYAPQTRVLIVGHSHRRRVSQRNGRTIINTGAFMFPGKPQCVIHQGDTLRVQRIIKRAGAYELAPKPVMQIKDTAFDAPAIEERKKPRAA